MPKIVWAISIAASVLFSVVTLIAGWAGGHFDNSAFWFLWGFVTAHPLSIPLGAKAAAAIIERLR